MPTRLFLIGLVFAMAAGLAWLQNRVMVGSQELFAQIQLADARQVEVRFKDPAGNLVDATPAELEMVRERLAATAQHRAIPFTDLELTDAGSVTFTAERDVAEYELRQHLVHQPFLRPNPPRDWFHINRGIDLRGGVEFNFTLREEDGTPVAADDEVIDILRQRLDARGLAEPQVFRLANGDGQVVIPGGSKADAARTRKVLETTGKLEFRELLGEYSGEPGNVIVPDGQGGWRFAPGSGKRFTDRAEVIYPEKPPRGEEPSTFYHLGPIALTGQDVSDAFRTTDQHGGIAVGINFTVSGGARNNQFTTTVKQKGPDGAGRGSGRIAISLDGQVASAPRIIEPSTRSCQITGNFSEAEVADLRQVLKAGSLAVKPEITSQRVVGPTLGHDTIVAGAMSMLGALLVVMAFIQVYYWWRLGTVAIISLGTTVLLIVTAVSAFGATLTLPGMAGLVLTVGMAVDANILIFERIREEIAPDVDVKTCIHAGYSRAFLTIFDANITTFLTAFVLYLIGSGPVKGFGLMLMIGIVTSLFGALYVGRVITDLLYRRQQEIVVPRHVRLPAVSYLRLRFAAMLVSSVVIIASLSWFAFGGKPARNFDIDFTGGNMVQATLKRSYSLEAVRDRLATLHSSDPEAFDLLAPQNMMIQPYYAAFTETGDETRQFMFKVRDDRATEIEEERNELVQQQGALQLQIHELQNAEVLDRAALAELEQDIAALNAQIQPLSEQLRSRVDVFQAQLAEAFGEDIGNEGD
ncbi:MAG: protein translocase subunit SecD, partial [Planctomycetota bacterium]